MSVTVRQYKKTNGWEVDIGGKLPNGKPFRRRYKAPVASRSAAKRWGEERERHLIRNGLPAPTKEVPTLREFSAQFLTDYSEANRHKRSTVVTYESIIRVHLVPHLGDKRLDQIDAKQIQCVKRELRNRSTKTVNCVLGVLRTMLRTAVEWRVIEQLADEIKFLKESKKAMAFYSFDELEALLSGARKAGPDVALSVLLGADAGLRLGEMLALEWGHIDFTRNEIVVQRADWRGFVGSTKGNKPRRVGMTARLRSALLQARHSRSPLVLCKADGSSYSNRMVQNRIGRAEKLAGMPVTHRVHILRHTFCSHLAMRGAPATAIQALAGHEKLETTEGYMHLSETVRANAIRLLEGRGTELAA